MKRAAIISDSKVVQVVDAQRYQITTPVSMVRADSFEVQAGDDYIDGKFYRNGILLKRILSSAELLEKLESADAIIDTLLVDNLILTEVVDALLLDSLEA